MVPDWRGHGRTDEVRHLVASTDLTGYLDWPGLAQVVRVERTWRERGQPRPATAAERGAGRKAVLIAGPRLEVTPR